MKHKFYSLVGKTLFFLVRRNRVISEDITHWFFIILHTRNNCGLFNKIIYLRNV